MDIKVQKFRLSLIWSRFMRGLVNGDSLNNMPFLTNKNDYTRKCLELLKLNQESGISLPWNQNEGNRKHHFWSYYLGMRVPVSNTAINYIDKNSFWEKFAPFRIKIDLSPLISHEGATINIAGYINCCSVTLRATIEWTGNFSIQDVWDLVYEAKEDKKFIIGNENDLFSIHEIADKAFAELLFKATGQQHYENISEITREPFIVMSVLKGNQTDELKQSDILLNKSFSDLQYVFYDITSWKKRLYKERDKSPRVPSPDQVIINNKFQHDLGDLFYHQKRGRIIWMPGYFENTVEKWQIREATTAKEEESLKNKFGDEKRNQKKISCFHNNILFLSIQLESLSMFIKEMDAIYQNANQVRQLILEIEDWSRRAAQHCSNLYLGKDENIKGEIANEKVYRSLSAKHHLTANKILDSLNSLRNRYNWPSLTQL